MIHSFFSLWFLLVVFFIDIKTLKLVSGINGD